MNDVTIDITKIKPFNCKHYRPKTYLSKSNCLGYCLLNDDLKYCEGIDCNEYEKRVDVE